MKSLLIGAGNSRKRVITINGETEFDDLTTLDLSGADINHDLEVFPYPFEDQSFDDISAYEVLEHTGSQGDFRFFFAQFNEFHRILKEDGLFYGSVPLYDSIWAWGDPGHKRVLPPSVFLYLTKGHYDQLGTTPCADYRPWIKGWWQAVSSTKNDGSLYFILRRE